ncbi:hypothetical protein QQY24_19650 [Streptomyces sp. TG1A-8]|uniref:hypothetical protein n=1 Tax=Streptomyces sp. TG1A-8 TaxID=3051385 RepID=UPI00265C4ABC|nr:hypothetical protein [Streptomyces sp. TG1A-8]MDO0927521.1 hypothetical protein [Streptomyces sp. TG1A-8]
MRRTTLSALAVVALFLTGCGSRGGDGDTGAAGTVSPSPSPTRSGTGAPGTGCTAQAALRAADDGRTVCVGRGGEVRLTLDGTRERPWKPVAASGGALEAVNAGLVLRPGDATAAYRAVAAGTVRLTSSRPLCAEPTAPGQVACKGIQEWTVTVRVDR